jgi:hypothetical protein
MLDRIVITTPVPVSFPRSMDRPTPQQEGPQHECSAEARVRRQCRSAHHRRDFGQSIDPEVKGHGDDQRPAPVGGLPKQNARQLSGDMSRRQKNGHENVQAIT